MSVYRAPLWYFSIRHINLSLHYLEQVIVALQEKVTVGRVHVPYRNSLLTWILRDSLGGNCKTSMIATISLDGRYLDETISTCRFSQRVALVPTNAMVNEETDPMIVIRRLKREIRLLEEEVAVLRGVDSKDPELTSEQHLLLRERLNIYVRSNSTDGSEEFVCASINQVCTLGFAFEHYLDTRFVSDIPAALPGPSIKRHPSGVEVQGRRPRENRMAFPKSNLHWIGTSPRC